jgi:predicted RNA binding protein YcfA (HicA-like mRNA interferase family)
MPKPLELRKVKRILKKYGIVYVAGKGRHPKFSDPETHRSYPIKSHGKKTLILPYALNDIVDKFDLPGDIFERK